MNGVVVLDTDVASFLFKGCSYHTVPGVSSGVGHCFCGIGAD